MTVYALTKDRSLKAIIPAVLLFHAALIFFLLHFSTAVPLPLSPKKITVTSIKLSPKPAPAPAPAPEPQAAAQPAPQPASNPVPQAEPKPAPKPELKAEPKPAPKPQPKPVEKPKPKATPQKKAPKPVAKKTPPPKPAPAPKPKETAPPVDEKKANLLNQARETIGKINLKKDNTVAAAPISTSLPQRIDSLSVDQLNIETSPSMGAHEIAYRDELAGRLKLLLKLPEHGTVKLKLTINRKGKVMKVQILSSESAKNRALIEKKLPELTLPSFGNQFAGLDEYTFTITMSNHD